MVSLVVGTQRLQPREMPQNNYKVDIPLQYLQLSRYRAASQTHDFDPFKEDPSASEPTFFYCFHSLIYDDIGM